MSSVLSKSQWPSIASISTDVQNGKSKALDLVELAYKTLENSNEFNSVISTTKKRAIGIAKDIDSRVKKGQKIGKLAGVPFIAKDNFLTFGGETTAASNILKGFNAPYQATAIERLEAEGAICVAKANLDAFGHGASTENSDFYTTKNPHDQKRVPGGSSGGSAAAVILDIVPFALGTDTGGSIRLPASFCGAVGYKPTYGLVSRSGVIAMASSTDTIGPLTRNIADAALILDIISGKDELDGTTIEKDKLGYTNLPTDIKGKKIGIVAEFMGKGVDPGVRSRIEDTLKELKNAGAELVEVSIPSISLALACYYIICPAEVSSNLSRYDGQRYGHTSNMSGNIEDSYNWSRSEGFGSEAKRRILIGTYVLSSGYYDAYYKKAQTLRTKLIKEFNEIFNKVDFLAGPVSPVTAFKIGQNIKDPLQMWLVDVLTVAPSLTGSPAVSVPAGYSDGMPVGIQLIAPTGKDRDLLALASVTEKVI